MTDETRQLPTQTVSHADLSWRCFHCDQVFTDRAQAKLHFGDNLQGDPICQLNALEGGLVKLVRDQEDELQSFRTQETASYREFYSIGGDHARALIREEQKGYDRGLADAASAKICAADMLRIVLANQLAMMGALHQLMRGFLNCEPLTQDRLSARISATRVLTDTFTEQLNTSQRPEGES